MKTCNNILLTGRELNVHDLPIQCGNFKSTG